jgi:RimJ/RimL family protein N-acetyltransferase
MACPLLSAGELRYCDVMDQKPALVSEQQPLVILTTQRLILRAAVEADISILQDLVFGDGEVMRFAFSGTPMVGPAAEDFIRRFFTFGSSLTGFAVLTEKPAGEIIGFAGLAPCGALGAADFEIGFVLARRAWGRGIATEIGEAQLVLGLSNSNAAGCSGWSIREMHRPFARSRSSACAIWRRLRTPGAEAGAFM